MGSDTSMLIISRIKKAPKNTFLRSYEGGNIESSSLLFTGGNFYFDLLFFPHIFHQIKTPIRGKSMRVTSCEYSFTISFTDSPKYHPSATRMPHQRVAPRKVISQNGRSGMRNIPAGIEIRCRTTGMSRPRNV